MSRPSRYWTELSAKTIRERPELLAQLEQGAPLSDALDALQLPRRLADELGEHPAVRAALARRRAALRAQLSDSDKGRRDGAQYELEVYHGVRRPGTKTAEERFAKVLARFQQVQPDAYRVLYDLLLDAGEVAR